MMFGYHPLIKFLMEALDLGAKDEDGNEKWPMGRFRDIYFNEACDKIILLTRNGGGNRESFPDVFEKLSKHPNFLREYDNDFDSTFAEFEFSVPEKLKKIAEQSKEIGLGYKSFTERFHTMTDKMKEGKKDDPEVQEALKNTEPLMKALKEFVEGLEKKDESKG